MVDGISVGKPWQFRRWRNRQDLDFGSSPTETCIDSAAAPVITGLKQGRGVHLCVGFVRNSRQLLTFSEDTKCHSSIGTFSF